MAPHETGPDWNDIPNEIKLIVVGYMDRDTRIALKLCSWKDKALVEHVPLRTLRNCSIFKLWTYSNLDSSFSSFNFDQTVMKLADYEIVDWLHVGYFEKLTSHNFYLKVRHFTACLNDSESIQTLKQLDPHYSKTVKLELRGSRLKETRLYEMPQVVTAERLSISSNLISDDQLMRLEAKSINLSESRKITATGINKFIKKHLQELNIDQFEFSISLPYYYSQTDFCNLVCENLSLNQEIHFVQFLGTAIVDSPFPEYKLELRINERQVMARRVVKNSCSDNFVHDFMENSFISFNDFEI